MLHIHPLLALRHAYELTLWPFSLLRDLSTVSPTIPFWLSTHTLLFTRYLFLRMIADLSALRQTDLRDLHQPSLFHLVWSASLILTNVVY